MATADKQDLAPGQVTIQAHGSGWWLVSVGRTRYTKRFNLSDAEARQLYALLGAEFMLTQHDQHARMEAPAREEP